jgi:hypothetical protein
MKLIHNKTIVAFDDKETGTFWCVKFIGQFGSKNNPFKGLVYRNLVLVRTYYIKFGHANKTRALLLIEDAAKDLG